MANKLRELGEVCNHLHVPLVIAGDIFDKWNSPPELINFAIKHIPHNNHGIYAVPGQHDLALHNYEDIRKSAYWTLVEAGTIENLPPGIPICAKRNEDRTKPTLMLWGFPWGHDPEPLTKEQKVESGAVPETIHLAVVHAYCWETGHNYPGANPDQQVDVWRSKLYGFSAAVFGDNHKGFLDEGSIPILNNGTFMVRRSDEVDYEPTHGILYDDGSIVRNSPLSAVKDEFNEVKEAVKRESELVDAKEFLRGLRSMKDVMIDFREAVRMYLKNKSKGIDQNVSTIILECLEDEYGK